MCDESDKVLLENQLDYSTKLIVNTTGTSTSDNDISYNHDYQYINMNKEQYYQNLKEKQRQHLDSVRKNDSNNGVWFNDDFNWKPCMHDSCPYCVGTGIKHDGSMCVHHISCNCTKCATYCF